jgi:hypothetical protein
MKIFLAFAVSLFLLQSVRAQDTVKHSSKKNKSVMKRTPESVETHKKDSGKARPVFVPKYARDGYVAVSGGLGAPSGNYLGAGCAASGTVYSISAGFPGIISHGGIAFKFDDGTNALNKNQFLESFSNGIGLTNMNYSFAGSVNPYTYKTLMTGLYLTYPAKNFSIDARILGGVMMATVPAMAVNMSDQTNGTSGIFYEGETSAAAFALDFGIQARYRVASKFCVILSADYLHADPSFLLVVSGAALNANGTSTGTIIQETGRQTSGADQPFSVFNLSLGVGYTITAKKPSAPAVQ